MRIRFRHLALAAVFLTATAHAQHQQQGQPGQVGSKRQIADAPSIIRSDKSNLPTDISTAPRDNIAGMLSYCVRNHLLTAPGDDPTPILDSLKKTPDIIFSSGYSAGEQGQLQLAGNQTFSIPGLHHAQKSRLCEIVTARASDLAARHTSPP